MKINVVSIVHGGASIAFCAIALSTLQNKVDALMCQWDKKFEAHTKKQLAEDMTAEAKLRMERPQKTLHYVLPVNDLADLRDNQKFDRQEYPRQPPQKYRVNSSEPRPVRATFIEILFGVDEDLKRQYQAKLDRHNAEVKNVEKKNADAKADWVRNRDDWNAQQDAQEKAFLDSQANRNAKVKALEAGWRKGQTKAVEQYASLVLEASDHDYVVPKQWQAQYDPEAKRLLVAYRLPAPDDFPTTKSVRFVASTGQLKKTIISERDKNILFEDLCYQICLRSMRELFKADSADHLNSIVFNGWTESIDRTIGQDVKSTILSVMVKKEEFLEINLRKVEPKACFKSLKGVSAASLVGLSPIAPIIEFDKADKRFIAARSVEVFDDGTTNLAAMDWEEFEHLVRELFEKEFASRGGDVHVTKSSGDGGVDAVAFDPDPISGGKIIIQAKRYTRTVGVAAVRDLYGTTMNEGAIKGILVTTADYGPEAHQFASDKPLTLMSGAHLLNLLEKHGINAKIDLKEARTEMGLRT